MENFSIFETVTAINQRMILLWMLFCLTYSAIAAAQENNEGFILQKDFQDFVRRLTQRQMQTTQQMRSTFLPQSTFSLLRSQQAESGDESILPLPAENFPFQSNSGRSSGHSFVSSFASVKRPYEDGATESKAAAYASLNDVDNEEHLAEDIELAEKSSTVSENQRSSPMQAETTYGLPAKNGPHALKHQQVDVTKKEDSFSDLYFVAIVAGCCAVGIFGVISAGICFYRLQKSRKAAADVDYPAYGVTGPCKDITSPNGDRKLAQSAQMYHYQHQKQQMIAVEKAGSTKNTSASDVDSEEEIGEEGDYTVYECPGLAPTGEMEVKNPLFHDDSTPVSPPVLPAKSDILQSN